MMEGLVLKGLVMKRIGGVTDGIMKVLKWTNWEIDGKMERF